MDTMHGLYALKPWYADRLARPRAALIHRDVSPTALSVAGVACAAAAGGALAVMPPGPLAGVAVGAALAARLACANLDGGVARATGRTSRWGSVVNELSDRIADVVAVAGLLAHAPVALVAVAALASTLPSWAALAGQAAGAARVQGGPVGKTERCALLVAAALLGHGPAVAAALVAGGVVTTAARLRTVHAELRSAA